jgi:hypothetical protein
MTRIPNDTDFTVVVDGIGKFTVGRRKMADEVAIQREYALILGGAEPTSWLHIVGNWIATFKVLIVFAPPGWDIDEMDPLENATYEKMKRVYDAISEKELSFRGRNGVDSKAARQEHAQHDSVPVSA